MHYNKTASFWTRFLFSFLLLVSLSPLHASDAALPQDYSLEMAQQLQGEILQEIDLLSMQLQAMGFRMEKVNPKIRPVIEKNIKDTQEILAQLRAQHVVQANPKKIATHIELINRIIKGIEKALENSLKASIIIDVQDSAAQIRSININTIDTLCQENRKRLDRCSYLIDTLHFNSLQKAYRAVSNKWNTELFTIPAVNTKVYASSLLKRAIIYPATLALVLYNVKEQALDNIPFEGMKNRLKGWRTALGGAPYIDQHGTEINYIPVQKVADATNGQPAKYAIPSPFVDKTTGAHIPKAQVINLTEMGNFAYPVKETISHSVPVFPAGLVSRFTSSFSWLVEPDLKVAFSLPVAAYLTKLIYHDVTMIGHMIPEGARYLHCKFRGEKFVASGHTAESPKETFDDIVGRKAEKEKFAPLIQFMSNPQRFINSGIKIPRGYILAGEPQTGKTFMVKALAGELTKKLKESGLSDGQEVKLFPITVKDLMTGWPEYGIQPGLASFMAAAKQIAPCILFCDEFDLVGPQRDTNKAFLAEALTALQGMDTTDDPQKTVFFIVATNCPQNIDTALLQDGRLGVQIFFEKPYFNDRKEFFQKFFEKRLINSNIDFDMLAHETENCNYTGLVTVADAILANALKYNTIVAQVHAVEAVDTVVRKILREGFDVPVEKQKLLAAHFGAQAMTSVLLNPNKQLSTATILKISEAVQEEPVNQKFHNNTNNANKKAEFKLGAGGNHLGGIFSYSQVEAYNLTSQDERIKECKVILAGTVAQKVLGLPEIVYTEDEQQALMIANEIVFKGLNPQQLPESIRKAKELEAYNLVETYRKEVEALLRENKDALESIVESLQELRIVRFIDVKKSIELNKPDA